MSFLAVGMDGEALDVVAVKDSFARASPPTDGVVGGVPPDELSHGHLDYAVALGAAIEDQQLLAEAISAQDGQEIYPKQVVDDAGGQAGGARLPSETIKHGVKERVCMRTYTYRPRPAAGYVAYQKLTSPE